MDSPVLPASAPRRIAWLDRFRYWYRTDPKAAQLIGLAFLLLAAVVGVAMARPAVPRTVLNDNEPRGVNVTVNMAEERRKRRKVREAEEKKEEESEGKPPPANPEEKKE